VKRGIIQYDIPDRVKDLLGAKRSWVHFKHINSVMKPILDWMVRQRKPDWTGLARR